MKWEARSVGRVKIDPSKNLPIHDEALTDVSFDGQRLETLSVARSRLVRCHFTNMKIEDASLGGGLEDSEFTECRFDGSSMHLGPGDRARFTNCSFQNVKLNDWRCFWVEMIGCTFSGSMVTAFFNGTAPALNRKPTDRHTNEFRGNDFSAMKFVDVGFRSGIDLSLQNLPQGPDYTYLPDAASAVAQTRREVLQWTDLDLRRKAFVDIDLFERNIASGQRQLFLRQKDYGKSNQKDLDPLYALLRKYA